MLIDDWVAHAVRTTTSLPFTMTTGNYYAFEFWYYERGTYAEEHLEWVAPGVTQSIIPFSQIFSNLSANVEVNPSTVSVVEGGVTSFQVRLVGTKPLVNITLPVSSSDTTEGTVSTSLLTFTPANYNTWQTVTVSGVQELLVDGNITYNINLGFLNAVG